MADKGFEKLKSEVISQGLCNGCGTCAGVCMTQAIKIDYTYQEPEPILIGDCNDCGHCVNVCSGKHIPLAELDKLFLGRTRDIANEPIGIYKGCYKGWAKNEYVRNTAASGGMVTSIMNYALENNIVDAILMLGWDKQKPYRAKPMIAKSAEDIRNSCSFTPEIVPVNQLLYDAVINNKYGKIGVVGLPCHIHSLRKLQMYEKPKRIANAIQFSIGLFCAAAYYFEGLKHLIFEFSEIESLDDIVALDHRGGGKGGGTFATTRDGRIHFIASMHDRAWHFLGPASYKRDRCLMCIDFSSELADISCGDIFQPVVKGTTKIVATITRTEIGEFLVQNAQKKSYIEYSEHDPELIPASGMGWESKKHAGLYRLLERKRFGLSVPDYQYSLEFNINKRKLSFPS